MSARAPERWAGFLSQIRERHGAVCAEAEASLLATLRAANHDPNVLATAWAPLHHRLQELETKIIETWDKQVEGVFESEGYPRDLQATEREKGEELRFALENAHQATEMRILATGAREMYARAVASQRAAACPRCGAALTVPFTYQAINVACPCGSTFVFEPAPMARNVVAFGAHPLAWEAAQAEWLSMRDAERRYRRTRPPVPIAVIKHYERSQIAFWTRYVGHRAHFEPAMQNVPLEVRSRMEAFYRSAEHEEEWVRAGRPRETI